MPNFRGALFNNLSIRARTNNSTQSLDVIGTGRMTSHPAETEYEDDLLFERDYRNMAVQIERAAKVIFPAGFVIFNCVYWAVYSKYLRS